MMEGEQHMYSVEEKNYELLIKDDTNNRNIRINISNATYRGKDEIADFVLNILRESPNPDDLINLDSEAFLLNENENYVYLDCQYDYSMSENHSDELVGFIGKIKEVLKVSSNGHCIIEMMGEKLTLVDASNIANYIYGAMEEILNAVNPKGIEPFLEFGVDNTKVENDDGVSKILLICFLAR